MHPRKLKSVSLSDDVLVGLLKGQELVDVEGLPRDAKCVSVYADQLSQSIVAVFYHKSFKEVPHGVVIPSLSALITLRRPEVKG